jgi:hypothetical protein
VICEERRIRGGMGAFIWEGGILCGRKKKEWGTFLEKCVVLLWNGES